MRARATPDKSRRLHALPAATPNHGAMTGFHVRMQLVFEINGGRSRRLVRVSKALMPMPRLAAIADGRLRHRLDDVLHGL